MDNIGLVLEGGGMRELYTCGVLKFFIEKELYFKYIIEFQPAHAPQPHTYQDKKEETSKSYRLFE